MRPQPSLVDMDEDKEEFSVGNIVRFKLGSPQMVIAEVDPKGTGVRCVWIDKNGRRDEGWFERGWVQKVTKPEFTLY